MQAREFIFWLTGFMECITVNENKIPSSKHWDHIQEILRNVTCWEIEQGDNK